VLKWHIIPFYYKPSDMRSFHRGCPVDGSVFIFYPDLPVIAQFQSTEVIRGTAFIPEDWSDRQKNPERFCNADDIKNKKRKMGHFRRR